VQIEQRRYHRIPVERTGTLVVSDDDTPNRPRHPEETNSVALVPIDLINVSREGVCGRFLRPVKDGLPAGALVRVCIPIAKDVVELPAQVAWSHEQALGLTLRLGDASQLAQRAYQGWIVPLSARAIARGDTQR